MHLIKSYRYYCFIFGSCNLHCFKTSATVLAYGDKHSLLPFENELALILGVTYTKVFTNKLHSRTDNFSLLKLNDNYYDSDYKQYAMVFVAVRLYCVIWVYEKTEHCSLKSLSTNRF